MSEPESGQAGRAVANLEPSRDDPAQPAEESGSGVSAPTPSAEETIALIKQLTVGTVIDGKYQIDAVIGKGAMGVVLAATHVHLKERVALKFLSARAHAQADDFHMRFRREAQVSAKLRNEHITRVIDVGMWREKIPFMVMDLLVGDDLRRTLRQSPEGRLSPAVALDYIVQICEGLAEAHSHGIVHRDLKPSNLFVTKRHDGTDLIKILDFGISKWSTHEEQLDELTQTGVVLGSPKYMAPEQLFGSATVDARADVWSIGAIFYEMLTGRPPYDFPTLTRICAELAADNPPPSLKQLVPDLPDRLEAVVMQCFARDRERRVPNVAEFAGALLDAVDAPFAGQVRQKIASMLDPRGLSGSVTGSGGMSLSTGNYKALAITGSTPAMLSSSGALRLASEKIPPSAATAAGVEALVQGDASAGKRRTILFAAIGAGIGIVILILAFSGGHSRDAAKEPPPPTNTLVAQPPPGPAPVAPSTNHAPAAAADTTKSTSTPPAAATAAPTPAPVQHGHWTGGGHHAGGTKSSTPAPPPAQNTAPPPPPTPAPPPPPAPTAKANPLEDRQ
jgi:eukaryotic-like serine/threonine-protein kinase